MGIKPNLVPERLAQSVPSSFAREVVARNAWIFNESCNPDLQRKIPQTAFSKWPSHPCDHTHIKGESHIMNVPQFSFQKNFASRTPASSDTLSKSSKGIQAWHFPQICTSHSLTVFYEVGKSPLWPPLQLYPEAVTGKRCPLKRGRLWPCYLNYPTPTHKSINNLSKINSIMQRFIGIVNSVACLYMLSLFS